MFVHDDNDQMSKSVLKSISIALVFRLDFDMNLQR